MLNQTAVDTAISNWQRRQHDECTSELEKLAASYETDRQELLAGLCERPKQSLWNLGRIHSELLEQLETEVPALLDTITQEQPLPHKVKNVIKMLLMVVDLSDIISGSTQQSAKPA